MKGAHAIPLADIEAARERVSRVAVRTPTLRLEVDEAPAEIHLKLESLQPIGSFKIRGAANRMLAADPDELAGGVWTASAGNMAQGVAWCARLLGVPCSVVVPDSAPETKLAATRRLGADVVSVPLDEWFEIFDSHAHEGMEGVFVHAFDDPEVMAGNGTAALELVEDLPDADAVLVGWGGGGLACGIASALRALRPETPVYAVEIETGAPLAASLAAGEPVEVEHTETFVDGIGSPRVWARPFELARELLEGSLVVGVDETAAAVRLLVERSRVVAEGAGAAPVAAALAGLAGGGKVACIVSGGNIDSAKLAAILRGETP
jgi:threonine dehydratase